MISFSTSAARSVMFILALALTSATCNQKNEPERPNVLLIFVDDLGYGDPGCYGGRDINTPNIDRLAAEGVRFTDAHVSCAVCGPSRLGLLTGMYQQKLGCYWNNDLWAQHGWDLPENVLTLPAQMKKNGYVSGHIGKWNISESPADYVDEYFDVMLWKGAYYPDEDGSYKGVNTGDFNPEPHGWGPPREGAEYLTDRLTRHACDFIERHSGKPFFLYLAYNAPHTPLQADIKYNQIYAHLEPEPLRIYAGMVSSLDENIGKVMDKLEELGLEENTLVIFTSDNGPARGAPYIKGWLEHWPTTLLGSAGPLNGHKAQRLEGGHREPFIVKWPVMLEGGQVYDNLTSALDIFPTICGAAGLEMPSGQDTDGVDLLPYLLGDNKNHPHDTLYWMNHQQAAIRAGKWKLILSEGRKVQLFDLNNDLGEQYDISGKHPDLCNDLVNSIRQWNAGHPDPIATQRRPDLFSWN
jgi:arylsulfatase A-like enzyme